MVEQMFKQYRGVHAAGHEALYRRRQLVAEVSAPGTGSIKWADYLFVGSAMIGMRMLQTVFMRVASSCDGKHLYRLSGEISEFRVVGSFVDAVLRPADFRRSNTFLVPGRRRQR